MGIQESELPRGSTSLCCEIGSGLRTCWSIKKPQNKPTAPSPHPNSVQNFNFYVVGFGVFRHCGCLEKKEKSISRLFPGVVPWQDLELGASKIGCSLEHMCRIQITAWLLFISNLMGSDIISLELLQTTGSLCWPRLRAGNKVSGKPTGCSRMKWGVFCQGNEDGVHSEGWVCSSGGGGMGENGDLQALSQR